MLSEKSLQEAVIDAVFSVALESVKKWIFTKVPFLGLSIFSPVVSFILEKLISKIQAEFKLQVAFIAIDLKNDKARRDYDKAVLILRSTEIKPGVTGEEIERAKESFKETLRNLIRFDTHSLRAG